MSDLSTFNPFENDSQILILNDFTIENGETEIVMSGSMTIDKTTTSQKELEALIHVLQQIAKSQTSDN